MQSRKKEGYNEFVFRQINLNFDGKQVLRDVCGNVRNGDILAVIGPKGSGKTTLTSVLAGNTKSYNGDILLDGKSITKNDFENKIAYVTAQDLFLPNLTVEETLKYSAMLRFSSGMPRKQQEERISFVKDVMGLHMFESLMVQFCSPCQKRCLSVACELVINPDILIIDEPMIGLSFKDSLDVMTMLKRLTTSSDITIVMSLQQASSSIYNMCSKSLFLYNGHMVYFGECRRLPQFLGMANFPCPRDYHSADYLLQLLCQDNFSDKEPDQTKLIQAAYQWRETENWPKVLRSHPHLSSFRKPGYVTTPQLLRMKEVAKNGLGTKGGNQVQIGHDNNAVAETTFTNSADDYPEDATIQIEHSKLLPGDGDIAEPATSPQWRTSYWNQFCVLTVRNFHNSRRRILFPIGLIQNGYILLCCILIWWRPERIEATIKDRLGLFFFTTVQWAFFALLDAISTFPKEMKVINKERNYKLYRVSAFCFAKTISEFPLSIIQPVVYICVIYWVANLNGILAFLGSVGVLVIDVFAAQSIGLFIGTAVNPPWTLILVSLGLLSMMLFGGAFATPPVWLQWAKYVSYFYYGLNAFIHLEFREAAPIPCDPTMSLIPICSMVDPTSNSTMTHFPSDVVLLMQNISWPLWNYIFVLFVVMVVMRLLWYIILRRKNPQA